MIEETFLYQYSYIMDGSEYPLKIIAVIPQIFIILIFCKHYKISNKLFQKLNKGKS